MGNDYKATGHLHGSPEKQVWSSSILKSLLRCESIYYRRYVLGEMEEVKVDSKGKEREGATDKGSKVHAYIEAKLKRDQKALIPFNKTPAIRRMGDNLLDTLTPKDKNLIDGAPASYIEQPFREELAGHTFSGTVDLDLVAQTGEFHDWKTTGGNPYKCSRCEALLDNEGVGPFDKPKPCPKCEHEEASMWMNEEALEQDIQANMYAFHFLRKYKYLTSVTAVWHYVETKTKESEVHVVRVTFTREMVKPMMLRLVQVVEGAKHLKELDPKLVRMVKRDLSACNYYGGCKHKAACLTCRPPHERFL